MSFSLPIYTGTKVVLGKDKTFIPGKKPYEGELSVSNLSVFGNHPSAPTPTATVLIGNSFNTPASLALDIKGNELHNGNLRHNGDTRHVGDVNHTGDSFHKGNFVVDGCFSVTSNCTAKISGGFNVSGAIVAGSLNGPSAGTLRSEIDFAIAQPAKPFDIPHPSKEGMRLRHVAIEGPEIAVYFRGQSFADVIEIPDYWEKLVDYQTITVSLTPFGYSQNLWVKGIIENKIYVGSDNENMQYYYRVEAERIDMDKLIVEYEGQSIHDYPNEWLNK